MMGTSQDQTLRHMGPVLAAFRKRHSAEVGSCRTDGQAIWSYEVRIAHWLDDGTVWLRHIYAVTPTTQRRILVCRTALCDLLERCVMHSDCRVHEELGRACAESLRAGSSP